MAYIRPSAFIKLPHHDLFPFFCLQKSNKNSWYIFFWKKQGAIRARRNRNSAGCLHYEWFWNNHPAGWLYSPVFYPVCLCQALLERRRNDRISVSGCPGTYNRTSSACKIRLFSCLRYLCSMPMAAFGGVCILAQTKSLLHKELSVLPYISAKCLNAAITAISALVFLKVV